MFIRRITAALLGATVSNIVITFLFGVSIIAAVTSGIKIMLEVDQWDNVIGNKEVPTVTTAPENDNWMYLW